MENEKALKVLQYLDSIGYLKGDDKKWFEKLINEPDTWKLWICCGTMEVRVVCDTEDFEYGFDIELQEIGLAVLNYMGISYELL